MYSLVLLCLLAVNTIHSIKIDIESENELIKLIETFELSPENPRYLTPFLPTEEEFRHICHVMIWSPIQQYNLRLCCPKDGLPLSLGLWSTVVSKESRRNPRLCIGLFVNVLFIQRRYTCQNNHSYLSSAYEIIQLLPNKIKNAFMFRKYARSMYTLQLVEYVLEHVTQGLNFQQISEIIADLHLKEFSNLAMLRSKNLDFYTSVLTSYPSQSKVETIFLDAFDDRREEFESAVNSAIPVECLSTDHTFKTGRNVGGIKSEDLKFVKKSMKLFIVFDGENKVVGWTLTKSTSHEEFREVLESVNARLPEIMKYIVVENCCESREFYQSIFGGYVPIKLDIFHAVQRLTETLPDKMSANSRKLSNKMGLLFRSPSDQGPTRTEKTPEESVIAKQFDFFVNDNYEFISKIDDLSIALGTLKLHITSSCVSDIDPGHGSEGIEDLRRILDDNSLLGIPTNSTTLITALLTVLFYSYNKRKSGTKHTCNSRIVPVVPVKRFSSFSENGQVTPLQVLVTENIDSSIVEMHILKTLADNIKQLTKSLTNIQETCQKGKFDITNLMKSFFLRDAFKPTDSEQTDLTIHTQRLVRNCAAFGARMGEIERDGDCLFRSLLMLVSQFRTDKIHKDLFEALNITFRNQADDILTLRSLFVNEVKSNEKYTNFLSVDDTDLDSYLKSGVYASNIGDFIVDACCNIFKMPIVLLTSVSDMSVEVFFPTEARHEIPIVLAYNCAEQHYTYTVQCDVEAEFQNKCKCSTKAELSCSDKKQRSRCPCLRNGEKCNHKCRCTKCDNDKQALEAPVKGCRCITSCQDGERKSRCKCYKANVGCGNDCSCQKCENPFGVREKKRPLGGKKIVMTPSRSHETSNKRFKAASNVPDECEEEASEEDSWTEMETVSIFSVVNVLMGAMGVDGSPENVFVLYHLLYENCSDVLSIRRKTLNQIEGKLRYMNN